MLPLPTAAAKKINKTGRRRRFLEEIDSDHELHSGEVLQGPLAITTPCPSRNTSRAPSRTHSPPSISSYFSAAAAAAESTRHHCQSPRIAARASSLAFSPSPPHNSSEEEFEGTTRCAAFSPNSQLPLPLSSPPRQQPIPCNAAAAGVGWFLRGRNNNKRISASAAAKAARSHHNNISSCCDGESDYWSPTPSTSSNGSGGSFSDGAATVPFSLYSRNTQWSGGSCTNNAAAAAADRLQTLCDRFEMPNYEYKGNEAATGEYSSDTPQTPPTPTPTPPPPTPTPTSAAAAEETENSNSNSSRRRSRRKSILREYTTSLQDKDGRQRDMARRKARKTLSRQKAIAHNCVNVVFDFLSANNKDGFLDHTDRKCKVNEALKHWQEVLDSESTRHNSDDGTTTNAYASELLDEARQHATMTMLEHALPMYRIEMKRKQRAFDLKNKMSGFMGQFIAEMSTLYM